MFELRDALRGLRRDRGFAAAVVLILAVTVGATTAAFSIVNGVLLRPPAFPDADRLVTLREFWREVMQPGQAFPVNERHFEHWRDHAATFESMAQYIVLPANLTSGGAAAQVSVLRTTTTLFDVLRVPPLAGRAFRGDDGREGAPDVAMLSEGLWRRRFGGRSEILGQSIVLDGKPFTVIGIWPAAFRLPSGERLLATTDAAIPMRLTAGWVGDHNNLAIGRLKPGVSIERAAAEIDLLQTQAAAQATRQAGQPVTLSGIVTPLGESIVQGSRRSLLLLFGSVLCVLLIACANLTNLALTRTLAHVRDAALRTALGASRARLLRHTLLEHALLGIAGGALGLWLASAALGVFVRTAPLDLPRVEEVTIDARVFGFAVLLTIATILFVSALPMWHLARRDPQEALRGGSAAGQGPVAMNVRAALTAVQVAMSVALLTVSALLGASLLRVLRIDYGFSADHVLSIPIAMPVARYADDARRVEAHERILESVKAIPGVRLASSTSLLPMRGEGQVNFLLAAGTKVPRSEQPGANFRFISPDYFASLQLPVIRGRSITLDDRADGAPMPAVISESVAARLWPAEADVIGRQFGRGIEGEADFTVVGVTPDARTTSIERAAPLMVYVPYWWRPRPAITLLVKTELDPVSLAASARRAIDRIDPEIAVGECRPLESLVDAALAGRRYQTRLFVGFGVVALAIATLGVYAVAAYSVARRRREMNIRVALGATKEHVLRLLMRQSGRAIAIGLAAGLGGALAAGRLTANLLYEVRSGDPMILGLAIASVAASGLLASFVAARHGLSVNPVAALRDE